MLYSFFMCETLDDIHDAQLASVIARMRKAKSEQHVMCN